MPEKQPTPDMTREAETKPNYSLDSNKKFLDFRTVTVTEYDETKGWKPALTVEVVQEDESKVEDLDANTEFFTFKDTAGKEIIVTAATAGHINELHVQGKEVGSKFDVPNMEKLMQLVAQELPKGLAAKEGIFTLSVETGKRVGTEGLNTMQELLSNDVLTQEDIDFANTARKEVQHLNREGSKEEREAFAEQYAKSNPDATIQFIAIRDEKVLVPTVKTAPQPTSEIFFMMGDNATGDKKALFTVAPGRDMPRHPIPGQYTSGDGSFDEAGYAEGEDKWFNTVMLAGE